MVEDNIIIQIEHVYFRYDDRWIIEDFHLSILDQEFVTIVGASGCGKTTLLNIIAGLLPPSKGRVVLKGNEITKDDIFTRDEGKGEYIFAKKKLES